MADQPPIEIRLARMDEIVDLRWRILRAGMPREAANFDGDGEPTTLHFAALQDGSVIGCVTILRRPWQDQPAWQLRGMAVDARCQRAGIGGELLKVVEHAVRSEPHSFQLWCNARTPAAGFYQRHGWELAGDEFVIPTAGPHYRMCKLLKAGDHFVR